MGLAAVRRRKGKSQGTWMNARAMKGVAQGVNLIKPQKPLPQSKSK